MLPYAAMAASELGSLFGRLPEWLAEGTGSYPTIVFDTVKNTEDYVPVHCKKNVFSGFAFVLQSMYIL